MILFLDVHLVDDDVSELLVELRGPGAVRLDLLEELRLEIALGHVGTPTAERWTGY